MLGFARSTIWDLPAQRCRYEPSISSVLYSEHVLVSAMVYDVDEHGGNRVPCIAGKFQQHLLLVYPRGFLKVSMENALFRKWRTLLLNFIN